MASKKFGNNGAAGCSFAGSYQIHGINKDLYNLGYSKILFFGVFKTPGHLFRVTFHIFNTFFQSTLYSQRPTQEWQLMWVGVCCLGRSARSCCTLLMTNFVTNKRSRMSVTRLLFCFLFLVPTECCWLSAKHLMSKL